MTGQPGRGEAAATVAAPAGRAGCRSAAAAAAPRRRSGRRTRRPARARRPGGSGCGAAVPDGRRGASSADQGPQDGHDDRGQESQRVADPGRLERGLGLPTSPGSPPAIRYRTPPIVRNSVARPARIPTIHTVVLLITWPMDAAASRCPAARPGTAVAEQRPGQLAGGVPNPGRGDESHRRVSPRWRVCGAGAAGAGAGPCLAIRGHGGPSRLLVQLRAC